jgi:hypothetical protein
VLCGTRPGAQPVWVCVGVTTVLGDGSHARASLHSTLQLLAPLSLRDVWIMSRAALFMKQLNVLDPDHELADPTGDRYYRHVLDWLREPTDEGYPHWEHTTRADDAWNLAEYGESSEGGCYTSDEDE